MCYRERITHYILLFVEKSVGYVGERVGYYGRKLCWLEKEWIMSVTLLDIVLTNYRSSDKD